MKYCTNCEHKIAVEDAFCQKCGHKVEISALMTVPPTPLITDKETGGSQTIMPFYKRPWFLIPFILIATTALVSVLGDSSSTNSNAPPPPVPVVVTSTTSPGAVRIGTSFPGTFNKPVPFEWTTLGSTKMVARDFPIQFSELSIRNLGSYINNDYGYTVNNPKSTLGQYIEIKFTAENTSDTQQVIELVGFNVTDQLERRFPVEQQYNCELPYKGIRYPMPLVSGRKAALKPGIPCSWTTVVEVSKDSNSFMLPVGIRKCTEIWCHLY